MQLIDKMGLSDKVDKSSALELFEELDKEKIGKIQKTKFVEYVNKKHGSSDILLKSFYEIISEELGNKSEKIIQKLKEIKKKEVIQKNEEILKDIDWIIKEISEQDLHEPEYTVLKKLEDSATKTGNVDNKNAVEYLTLFSRHWDQNRKNEDLKKITTTKSIKAIPSFVKM